MGKGSRSCPASRRNDRYTTWADVPEHRGQGLVCRVHSFLPVSYVISRPFFSNPSSYDDDDDEDDPLGSFSPPSSSEAAIPPQQWDSSAIGNKLCLAKSDGKMTKPRNYNFHSFSEREIKKKKGKEKRKKKKKRRVEGKSLPFPVQSFLQFSLN